MAKSISLESAHLAKWGGCGEWSLGRWMGVTGCLSGRGEYAWLGEGLYAYYADGGEGVWG